MQKLIVIAGPTATGKTQAAVELALRIKGEIISADSMQVYRGMDIGTAKPDTAERKGVAHHLIDVVNPDDPFSAALYQKLAVKAIQDIAKRGKIPILTGGTGFYINAVVYGNRFDGAPETMEKQTDDAGTNDDTRRKYLITLAHERGGIFLHDLLRKVDPVTAESVHPHNIKRVARALCFYYETGLSMSEHNAVQRDNAPVYDVMFIVLDRERRELYERINARVTHMLQAGLVDEVRILLEAGYHAGLVSMQGLGYKETAVYLRGDSSLDEAAEAIRTGTRRYAKRQLTWFRSRAPKALWLDASHGPTALSEDILHCMQKREGYGNNG